LFASETEKAQFWVPLLEQALPNDRFVAEANNDVDIAIVATPPAGTLARVRGAKLIQSLWMGVEKLLADPGLPQGIPIARLIDPGSDAARKLLALGFNVAGYSRRPKELPGVQSFTDLAPMLRVTDALVCLLPLTPQTRGILNGRNLGQLKKYGCVINLARGAHL